MTDYEKLKAVLEEIGVPTERLRCYNWESSKFSNIEIGDEDEFIEINFENGKFSYIRVYAEPYGY